MNLNGIARVYTGTVSPPLIGTVYVSVGAVTNADYTRTPGFAVFPGVRMDVQALSGQDLRHMDALNIQGAMRAVYLNGNIEGVDRPAGKGGDVLWFNSPLIGPRFWLVTQVLEAWDSDGWCKLAVTMQDGPPPGIAP